MSEQKKYKRKPYLNFYKPLKKENSGAAFQFSYDPLKLCVFLEATSQKGALLPQGAKDQFDWNRKIVFKLGIADMGKLLLMFSGAAAETKLVHTNEDQTRTSAFEVKPGAEFKGQKTFGIKLSRTIKSGDDAGSKYVQMFLNQEEMSLFAHFVRESLTRMFGFDYPHDDALEK